MNPTTTNQVLVDAINQIEADKHKKYTPTEMSEALDDIIHQLALTGAEKSVEVLVLDGEPLAKHTATLVMFHRRIATLIAARELLNQLGQPAQS